MSADTHTYGPRIRVGTAILDMEANGMTPLESRDVQYANRVSISQVPLRNGGVIYDVRRAPSTLSFAGVIRADNREQLYSRMDLLHSYLVGGASTPNKFTFYTFYNQSLGNYRYWRNCACTDLNFSLTSRTTVYAPYAFSFTSEDGFEYEELGNTAHNPDVPIVTEIIYGPRVVKLSDDAGASSFTIVNSAGNIIFKVDSAGNVQYTGTFEQVPTISL